MKMFWKLLGAAALAVGLTPYRVEENEETGEKKYQALLWQATRTPGGDGENGSLNVNIGFRMSNSQEEEHHLFSDELCVEYTGAPVAEEAEPAEAAKAEEPAEPEVPAETPSEEVEEA